MGKHNINVRAITAQNLKNLERLRDGELTTYVALIKDVLVGVGHNRDDVEFFNSLGDSVNRGVMSVKRNVRDSTQNGTLSVLGFPDHKGKRANFIAGIRLFTNMKVEFV